MLRICVGVCGGGGVVEIVFIAMSIKDPLGPFELPSLF